MELRGSIFWVLSTSQFIFSTAIEVERSEPSEEPGTIIPKGLDIHVFINFGTNSFHIQDARNKKLSLVRSNLTLGTNKSILTSRRLFLNNSKSDIGILYFNSLSASINV